MEQLFTLEQFLAQQLFPFFAQLEQFLAFFAEQFFALVSQQLVALEQFFALEQQ